MKKIVSLISALSLFVCLFSVSALADESTKNNQTASDFFINFIENCFSDGNQLEVIDTNGNNVTDTVYNGFYSAYCNGNYSYILNYSLDNNLSLSRIWTVDDSQNISANNSQNLIGPNSMTEHKTVSHEKYYSRSESEHHRYVKEWTIIVAGTFYYNGNTYSILSSRTPTVSMGGPGWGADFSPYMENASAWYTISSDKSSITYYGRFETKCSLLVVLGDYPFGKILDYGSSYDSFSAQA